MAINWESLEKESSASLFSNWINSKDKTLDDFLIWLEIVYAGENTTDKEDKETFKLVKKLADAFLGYHPEKIKAGEGEALKKWIESTKDYV